MKRLEFKISENKTRIIYVDDNDSHQDNSSANLYGVKITESRAADGSVLDKPMSKAYMENIRNRKFKTDSKSPKVFPGDYGSGKKLPKGY